MKFFVYHEIFCLSFRFWKEQFLDDPRIIWIRSVYIFYFYHFAEEQFLGETIFVYLFFDPKTFFFRCWIVSESVYSTRRRHLLPATRRRHLLPSTRCRYLGRCRATGFLQGQGSSGFRLHQAVHFDDANIKWFHALLWIVYFDSFMHFDDANIKCFHA